MVWSLLGLNIFSGLGSVPGWAGSPWREAVTFSVVSNVPIGRSVYVVGSHPDMGQWNPVRAHRLVWNSGDVWTGQVAVQSGTDLEYKFISRTDSAATYSNVANAHWMAGPNLALTVPTQPPAPYPGKTIFYLSGWTNAFVLYSMNGVDWTLSPPMERVGPGRSPGEFLYRAEEIGVTGSPIQFALTGYNQAGQEEWDNAPYPGFGQYDNDYYTTLDVFWVQDGDVFNYRPPASVSAPTILTQFVGSSVGGIPGRDIKVYLPRGYVENTNRFYPVFYLHDGQNVFSPGGPFGSWDSDLTATREISQGRAREAILVAINNNNNRNHEYRPPGDIWSSQPGIGHLYANFVIHNVRPYVDTTFRTRNDRANTLVAGSSLGGLISAYFGINTNVFGKVGAFSPSFWIAPNYRGWLQSNDTHGVRMYYDCGTTEGASMWDHFWPTRATLLWDGYVENLDLLTVVGIDQGHNEAAWRSRFPMAMRYLLSLHDEPNRLAGEIYPPQLEVVSEVGETMEIAWEGLGHFTCRVQSAEEPGGTWVDEEVVTPQERPWEWRNAVVEPSGGKKVIRVRRDP
ncbi:MAG TPA: alpha/beta hydrolase-fold protein [Kiritimatiellia bacterium]|nr:alpha/beta hydrolase-fold protein [Kiritimatiellia bacterium]